MAKTKETILLLGGAGFIGSHVALKLHRQGKQLRLLVRPNTNLKSIATILNDVEIQYGDFTDPSALRRALQGVNKVVHLISSTLPISSQKTLYFDISSNLLPTQMLAEICLQQEIEKLVFISSGGAIYGEPVTLPISEDHPLNPTSEYGLGKKLIETLLDFLKLKHGLPVTTLRLSNPYGPGQDPRGIQGLTAVAFGCAIEDRPFILRGDGSTVRDYLYIEDTVEAILSALSSPENHTLNISSGGGVSTGDLLEQISAITGKKIEIDHQPANPNDIQVNIVDNSRAAATLNWHPTTPLPAGLQLTWKWIQTQT